MKRQPPPSRLRYMLKGGICEGSYDLPPFIPYQLGSFVTVECNDGRYIHLPFDPKFKLLV